MKPIWIVVEGIDGSGKTTVVKLISDFLSKDKSTLMTRAVGAGDVGNRLRDLYVNDEMPENLKPIGSLVMHIEHYITVQKALSLNTNVVSDRYIGSFFALNVMLMGQDNSMSIYMTLLDNKAVLPVAPDLTIFVDADNKVVKERLSARGTENALDLKFSVYMDRVRLYFKSFFHQQDVNAVTVKNNGSLQDLEKEVKFILTSFIGSLES